MADTAMVRQQEEHTTFCGVMRSRRMHQPEGRKKQGPPQHSHCGGKIREKDSSSHAGNWEKEPSEGVWGTGGECVLGIGLALANQSPRCSRIQRITWMLSITTTTRIAFLHRGPESGQLPWARARAIRFLRATECTSRKILSEACPRDLPAPRSSRCAGASRARGRGRDA